MKKILSLTVLILGKAVMVQAQKIGWTNVELILAYMPETEAMEKKLAEAEKAELAKLEVKQKYYQQKMLEYMEQGQAGNMSDAEMAGAQQELAKLEQEVQAGLQKAEQKLMQQRMAALAPIQEKMQTAINDEASEGQYDYILNKAMGTGIPTIIFGAESEDVTLKIAKKLGIDVGDEEE